VQSYRPIEVIIVDDGSTDATPEMARSLAAAHPAEVRCLRIANGGPGVAREAGRRDAKGAFIQHLDSDDLLQPHKFELQVSGLRQHPECAVAYGKTRFYRFGEQACDKPWKRTGDQITTMFPSFLKERWWDTSTPLYRREITDRAGPWTSLRQEEDWEYDCRIASQGIMLYNCRQFVSDTRAYGSRQLSSQAPVMLADRSKAHELILDHARKAGISCETHEMQHFARELFLLSRQCGAAGLDKESERLFHLARGASLSRKRAGLDFRIYEIAARAIGWSRMGQLAQYLDGFRG